MSLRKLINQKQRKAAEMRAQIRSELELVKQAEKAQLDAKRQDYIRAKGIDDEYSKYKRRLWKQNHKTEGNEEELDACLILNDEYENIAKRYIKANKQTAKKLKMQIQSDLELVKLGEKARLEAKRKDYLRAQQVSDDWEVYAKRMKNEKLKAAQDLRSKMRSDLELAKMREKAELDARRQDYLRMQALNGEYDKLCAKMRPKPPPPPKRVRKIRVSLSPRRNLSLSSVIPQTQSAMSPELSPRVETPPPIEVPIKVATEILPAIKMPPPSPPPRPPPKPKPKPKPLPKYKPPKKVVQARVQVHKIEKVVVRNPKKVILNYKDRSAAAAKSRLDVGHNSSPDLSPRRQVKIKKNKKFDPEKVSSKIASWFNDEWTGFDEDSKFRSQALTITDEGYIRRINYGKLVNKHKKPSQDSALSLESELKKEWGVSLVSTVNRISLSELSRRLDKVRRSI